MALNSTFGQRALQVYTEVVLSAHGGHGSLARERIVGEDLRAASFVRVRYTPVVRRCDTEDFRDDHHGILSAQCIAFYP